MRLTEIARLVSAVILASFIALIMYAGGQKAFAQTAQITINNYCSETIWVGAFPGVSSGTITGGSNPGTISTLSGWELDANATATVTVPDNWSGRFWGRTGCSFNSSGVCDPQNITVNGNNYVIANCCDTGGCQDGSGNFVLNCGGTGLPPATLAEFTLAAGGLDNYDVSMVDGGNIPVEIIPDPSDYDCATNGNCIFTGNLPGKNSSTCTQDSDCYALFGFGYKWKCDPAQKLCVNPFFCGSPGCTDTNGCAPSGITESLLPNSAWVGTDIAVSESACPSTLQLTNNQNQGSKYVGCFAPQKFCRQSCTSDGQCGPPYTFNCGSSGFCEDSATNAILGAECDVSVDNTTYGQLWGCTGVNAASCFTANAGNDCCGCPTWAPGFSSTSNGACIGGNNPTWQANALPTQAIFNNASPTAYAFPYDDAIKLFNCQTATAGQAVNYTVNFCPNDSDGDSVQNSQDTDSDNDGATNTEESDFSSTALSVEARSARELVGTPEDGDGDGILNWLDLDSDNDGIPDHAECGGTNDKDRDGRSDNHVDLDGDGHHDLHDPDQGGSELSCTDTDGDGIPDFLDIDSDNDGVSDFVEHGGIDEDGDGLPDSIEDKNGDGLLDIFHPETGDPLVMRDSDGDGIPDHLDAESTGGGGGCSIASTGSQTASALVYLMIPALLLLRRKLRRS